MLSNFYRFKILWKELESLRPILNYTCDIPCNCVLSKIYIQYRDSEYVIYYCKDSNSYDGTTLQHK